MGTSENKGGRPAKKRIRPFTEIFRQLILGETQQVAADKIGVSRQNIGKWLSGSTTPDIDTLGKIADAYNVSTDYLLGRVPNKTTDPDLKAIYNDIGLTEKAIENIKQISNKQELDILNLLFANGEMTNILEIIASYAVNYCIMLCYSRLYKISQEDNSDNSEYEQKIKVFRESARYFETSASMQIKEILEICTKYKAQTELEFSDIECKELEDLANSFYKGKELNIDFRKLLFDDIVDDKEADEDG